MKIAVAGGTGHVGRFVVSAARARGHEVVLLVRTKGVDLFYGEGIAEALAGVDAVIDVSNTSALSRSRATAFFETATRNLLAAGSAAGVGHHVTLSIVGSDRVPMGYYQAKTVQEALVRDGDVPWTILRTTQFHEFAGQFASRTRGPLVPVPTMATRPVAAAEVADRLVDLAQAAPAGDARELAGPQVHALADLVRRWLSARGERRAVVPLPLFGAAATALKNGGLLPQKDVDQGQLTFDAWLAAGDDVAR